MTKFTLGLLLAVFTLVTVNAAEKIGDPAPELKGVQVLQVYCPCDKCGDATDKSKATADKPKDATDTPVVCIKKSKDAEIKVGSNQTITFKTGKIYVVECWATWCPPCVASISHLTKLQKEYGDKVTILGISVDDKVGEVKKFMKEKKSPKFGYTVLHDSKGNVHKEYMKGFKRSGIPSAFIVDKEGKVSWTGHPESLDAELAKMVK